MNAVTDTIRFENVSKFYGEVLGVNRVSLTMTPGITTLVGPNGSGKTTLMNLMTGLVQPSRGTISVLGLAPSNATEFFCNVGYCAQFDSFPRGLTGFQFVLDSLMLFGMSDEDAYALTAEALRARSTRWRSVASQDCRIQQGHAAEDQAGAGDRASSARAGAG